MTREDYKKIIEKEGKIDPVKYGIARPGKGGSPKPTINGREPYQRIFIRLRTPEETLTCSPIQDGADFAKRTTIIENWFNSVVRKGNFILTFEALQVTDEEADRICASEEENKQTGR